MTAPERTASRTKRLLWLHLASAFGAVAGAWLWFVLGAKFPPCAFHRITGLECLTCGATRAVGALLNGELLLSLQLNPIPILIALFLAVVILHELRCLLRGEDKPFRYGLHCTAAIVFIALVYCILRNIGLAPIPAELI